MSNMVQNPSERSEGKLLTVDSMRDLERYFHAGAKPKSEHRIGIECEIFGIDKSTGRPIPYFGNGGVESVLNYLADTFAWKKIEENGHVIALERDADSITLEPGGQIELSAGPVRALHDVDGQILGFQSELKAAGDQMNVSWLSIGVTPFSKASDMPWVPKERYRIMRRYFENHGPRSHHMMQRTATDQCNLDYENEADAVEKMRVVCRICPFIVASFAHSPLFEGHPSGYQSYRTYIWQGTDPDRTGLLRFFVESRGSFSEYLDYILDVPAFFIVRGREWIPLHGLRFREFISSGFQGHRATLADFELHLSTVFPECRLKQHIEVRCIDAQAPEFIIASFAFWKGILSSSECRTAALDIVREFSTEDIFLFYRVLPKEGLCARAGKQTGSEISKKLFETALAGLLGDEQKYLELFYNCYVTRNQTPADELLKRYQTGKFSVWSDFLKDRLI